MDIQTGDSDAELPFDLDHAFVELYGLVPSDEARDRLRKVNAILKLDASSALWSILLALEYHDMLYRSLPLAVEGLSDELLTSFMTALGDLKHFEDYVSQDFSIVGDTLLTEVIESMNVSIVEGFTTPNREIAARLSQLVAYVHPSAEESTVTESVKSGYEQMASRFQSEIRSTMKSTNYKIAQICQAHNLTYERNLFIALATAGILGLLIGIYFIIVLIGNFNNADAVYRVTQNQQALQSSFFHGLDRNTRAILKHRNTQLPPDRRLFFQ